LYIALQNPRKFISLTPDVLQTYAYGPPMLFSAITFAVIHCVTEGAKLMVWCLISITGSEMLFFIPPRLN